jgi:multidrug efflux pump subunit AcrA (membrane-fusion protein)
MSIKKNALSLLVMSICLLPTLQAAEIVPVETVGSQSQSVLGSTVVPYKEVTLTAQIPGAVKFIAGGVGSAYKQGDLIVQIDDAQITAKRNAVLAQINIAQSALQNAQAQYNRELASPRSKDVGGMPGFGMPAMFDMFAVRPFADSFMGNYDSKVVRQTDLMNASSGITQAQGNLQQSMAQLQEIDSALKDASSIAPFEGIIMSKSVEVGDTVQPGQPLITYGYIKYKRLQADVPSGLVGNLSVGMTIPAKVDGKANISVRVAEIYPIADPSRHTVTVKFDLPMDVSAAPGMYAEIYMPERKKGGSEVLVIPTTALLTGSSLPSVLVVKADNTSELRLVRLGTEQGNGKMEVISGLSAGEKIIDHPPAGVPSGWMPTAPKTK